jgi:hypothetical protein
VNAFGGGEFMLDRSDDRPKLLALDPRLMNSAREGFQSPARSPK